MVFEALANRPRRLVHGSQSWPTIPVRLFITLFRVIFQDEHLFYHDGLPSYGDGDNCP